MQNLQEVVPIVEQEYEPRFGYNIVVTMWNDRRWTAWIAKTEPVHGAEHVLMDNEIVWDERPDEADLHTYVECALEG